MSLIISQDITQPFDLSRIDRSRLSSRDLIVLGALQNDTWLPNTTAIEQKHCLVNRDLLFQILMLEDIGKSKLSQIDDIATRLDPKTQKIDRLSTGRDKVVVNQVNVDNEEATSENRNQSTKKAVYKLTLQDKSGAIFYAVSATDLPWLSVCMLGSKLIISEKTQFVRGVFLLNDSHCTFLGGVNQVWNESREVKLRDYLEAKMLRESESRASANSKKRKNIQ